MIGVNCGLSVVCGVGCVVVVGSTSSITEVFLVVVETSWLISEAITLPGALSGQHTPGTKRLWKQIDLRKLSSCSNNAGHWLRSRQRPDAPSGVVHVRMVASVIPPDVLVWSRLLVLEEPLVSIFSELLFWILSPSRGRGVGINWLRVSLPRFNKALPRPRPSRWSCDTVVERVWRSSINHAYCISVYQFTLSIMSSIASLNRPSFSPYKIVFHRCIKCL